jgi:hypothetical protein
MCFFRPLRGSPAVFNPLSPGSRLGLPSCARFAGSSSDQILCLLRGLDDSPVPASRASRSDEILYPLRGLEFGSKITIEIYDSLYSQTPGMH